jgi:broad-specificity NMP kinase
MVRAIVIIGAPGAGKTSVLQALAGELENDAVPHAALESEQFAAGYPWLSEEDAYQVLGIACAALKRRGRSLFLAADEIDLRISTDGRTARDVAREIRSEALGR